MQESVLVYRNSRYLKLAVAVVVVAIVAYVVDSPIGVPNGGTWLGYTLGTIGALLILWLMWFGMRKRNYGPGNVQLEDWLSAHIYLGLALVIVATLHTGFQFGINVHTLAYTLMMLVILSGVFGLYAYIRYPREMTENRRGVSLNEMMQQIADLDRECSDVAMGLSDEINDIVHSSRENTRLGGGLLRQLSGHDPDCATTAALNRVQELATKIGGAEDDDAPPDDRLHLRSLIVRLNRKVELLDRARKDIRFQALMRVWLLFHIPISFALFAALLAHVVSVFFYW